MDIPETPCKSKRSNTDPPAEPWESAVAEVHLADRWLGTPVDAIEAQAAIPIPADMMRKKNIYLLCVKGDSMIGDHVLKGDHLILEKRNAPHDGEMVVAVIRSSEANLKRFYRDGYRIRLESANPFCETIVLDEKDVAIQGVVVGILRKYQS